MTRTNGEATAVTPPPAAPAAFPTGYVSDVQLVGDPALARDAAVHTEGLSKIYKDFWGRPKVEALLDLNLTIHRGEVFGLLGPNGSGKSTTIKLLLGLIFPTAGSARILGQPAGSTAINEKIVFLPEESYLYRFL